MTQVTVDFPSFRFCINLHLLEFEGLQREPYILLSDALINNVHFSTKIEIHASSLKSVAWGIHQQLIPISSHSQAILYNIYRSFQSHKAKHDAMLSKIK